MGYYYYFNWQISLCNMLHSPGWALTPGLLLYPRAGAIACTTTLISLLLLCFETLTNFQVLSLCAVIVYYTQSQTQACARKKTQSAKSSCRGSVMTWVRSRDSIVEKENQLPKIVPWPLNRFCGIMYIQSSLPHNVYTHITTTISNNYNNK